MRKQWTRGMAILLVLTLVLALAGCGGDVPDSSVDTSTGDTTTTTTTTATKVTTPSTTINFDWDDEGDTILNPAGSDDPVAKYTTTFDEVTGTLTVSGKGRLKDLYPRNWVPSGFTTERPDFKEDDHQVRRLVIGEGITYLYNCFNDMVALEEIVFPSTLKTIERSFLACEALEELTVPATVGRIWYYSFWYCSKLKHIDFQGRIKLTCPGPFNYLDALEEVSIPAGSDLCGAFDECKNLETVTLGAMVRCHVPDERPSGTPCEYSLSGCPLLEQIYIYKPIYEPKTVSAQNGLGGNIWVEGIHEGIGKESKYAFIN